MRRTLLLSFAIVSACSQSAREDLQYIKQARSIAGEWALLNEQARAGRVTTTYARSMHFWLRDNLRTTSASLTQPDSRYGAEIRALLAEPIDAAPAELRSHAKSLKQIEDQLESD